MTNNLLNLNTRLTNPLEQFEVTSLVTIPNVFVITIMIISTFFLIEKTYNFRTITVFDMVLQGLKSLISSLQRENLALTRQYFFMPVSYVFFFILLSNVSGLAPFAFTLTSSFIVTFFLASTFFILINVLGVFNLKWDMFNLFLPSGTPLAIIPFLIIIELISYIARVFSLAIRLFANMMSGHALLKILIGFAFAMFASGSVMVAVLGFLPWGIVNVIVMLEMLIAFLQAYVFVVLLTLYLSDVLFKH